MSAKTKRRLLLGLVLMACISLLYGCINNSTNPIALQASDLEIPDIKNIILIPTLTFTEDRSFKITWYCVPENITGCDEILGLFGIGANGRILFYKTAWYTHAQGVDFMERILSASAYRITTDAVKGQTLTLFHKNGTSYEFQAVIKVMIKRDQKYFYIFIAIYLFCTAVQSYSQPDVSTLSLKGGLFRNFFPEDYRRYTAIYSIYPELELGGALVRTELLTWSVYAGYWDDGVEERFPIADGITYSYNSIVLGGRLGFMPGIERSELPVQPGVFVGISHHFINADYVGGAGFDGKPGNDFRQEHNYFELGFNLTTKLRQSIHILFEGHRAIRISENNYGSPKTRWAFKLGIAYRL